MFRLTTRKILTQLPKSAHSANLFTESLGAVVGAVGVAAPATVLGLLMDSEEHYKPKLHYTKRLLTGGLILGGVAGAGAAYLTRIMVKKSVSSINKLATQVDKIQSHEERITDLENTAFKQRKP